MPAQPRLTPEMVGEKPNRPPMPEPPDQPLAVSLIDLPGDKMEAIEEDCGTALANWRMASSTHRQIAAVVAAVYDLDFEVVRKLSLRRLSAYVTIEMASDDDPGNG